MQPLPSYPQPLPPAAERILVGTAGWSYADWIGTVYPPAPGRSVDHLALLARFLDVVEINATFYRPARREHAHTWVERTAFNPRFRFSAKLDRVFTHESSPPAPAAERAFRDGIAPLAEAGVLAAVLVQFPYAFRNTPDNRARLARILGRFADYPLAVELRHRNWMAAEILAFLSARGVALVGIDQPQVGQPVAPSLPLTTGFFYARLHGRNAENWFKPGAGRDARYDYLYAAEELAPWIDRMREAGAGGTQGIVIANNHYRGQAVANAVEIRAALHERTVAAPAELLVTYPRLAAAARPLPAPPGARPARQPRLF